MPACKRAADLVVVTLKPIQFQQADPEPSSARIRIQEGSMNAGGTPISSPDPVEQGARGGPLAELSKRSR